MDLFDREVEVIRDIPHVFMGAAERLPATIEQIRTRKVFIAGEWRKTTVAQAASWRSVGLESRVEPVEADKFNAF